LALPFFGKYFIVGKEVTPVSGGTSADSIFTVFILPFIFFSILSHAG
jgi:hypothetical protein